MHLTYDYTALKNRALLCMVSEYLARAAGVSTRRMKEPLAGKEEWTLSEMEAAATALGLTGGEITECFFQPGRGGKVNGI